MMQLAWTFQTIKASPDKQVEGCQRFWVHILDKTPFVLHSGSGYVNTKC